MKTTLSIPSSTLLRQLALSLLLLGMLLVLSAASLAASHKPAALSENECMHYYLSHSFTLNTDAIYLPGDAEHDFYVQPVFNADEVVRVVQITRDPNKDEYKVWLQLADGTRGYLAVARIEYLSAYLRPVLGPTLG